MKSLILFFVLAATYLSAQTPCFALVKSNGSATIHGMLQGAYNTDFTVK